MSHGPQGRLDGVGEVLRTDLFCLCAPFLVFCTRLPFLAYIPPGSPQELRTLDQLFLGRSHPLAPSQDVVCLIPHSSERNAAEVHRHRQSV